MELLIYIFLIIVMFVMAYIADNKKHQKIINDLTDIKQRHQTIIDEIRNIR